MTDNPIDTAAKQQIRVCFVSLDIYPLLNPNAPGVQGGSEVDFYMLATELAKDRRFRVSVITGDFGQPHVEKIGDITIYKTANPKNTPLSAAVTLWRAMRQADADIYFRKGVSLVTDLVTLFCRLHHKALFFRTAQDLECDGLYLRQHCIRGKTYLWSLRSAKYVFVQKNADVSNMQRTTGVSAIAMPNGHRITALCQQNREFVLWVGRSDVVKQPRLFVQLAREIASEQFVMICQQVKGDNDYQNLVSFAEHTPNLKFLKYVPFNEIDDYFQKAKVFVNTSDAEGFPNTFIQAGKCSAPILSLNVNPDGFLDKFHCGICGNGDWTKLVESLKSLSEQPASCAEMGKNARKYVEETHDISKIIEKYKKFFVL